MSQELTEELTGYVLAMGDSSPCVVDQASADLSDAGKIPHSLCYSNGA